MAAPAVRAAVVIPNWNGAAWLTGCLDAVAAQTHPPEEVVVVDGASSDDSLTVLSQHPSAPRVVQLGANLGFGAAANRGIAATCADAVALVNTDVVLAEDWLERALAALASHADAAAVATKMVALDDPGRIDDTGDFLGRDGAAVQRGKFRPDHGQWDAPGEVWGACAGAALYRRDAVLAVGGFDERFFMYLEDVDLALRLHLAGWRCRYEPAVARHAAEGSSGQLSRPPAFWVARNNLLLVAKAFPLRWAPFVLYRQAGYAWHAARQGRLRAHVRGLAAAVPLLPAMLRERSRLRRSARVPIEEAIPARPIRGPRALGHPRSGE
ncbi:MAG: glycosyltransferase family 2 protein [Thermoleophilaceae bacterium]|nr:glycosyltransferase family 2 protein [Thermoleophilaceae bacterium]